MTRNAVPFCSPTSYRVQMCGCVSCEMARASRSNRSRNCGSPASVVWQDLDRDRAVESRVARFVHLAHATGAKQRQDFVGAKPRAGGQGHSLCDCTGGWPETATNMPRLSVPSSHASPSAPNSSGAGQMCWSETDRRLSVDERQHAIVLRHATESSPATRPHRFHSACGNSGRPRAAIRPCERAPRPDRPDLQGRASTTRPDSDPPAGFPTAPHTPSSNGQPAARDRRSFVTTPRPGRERCSSRRRR